MKKLFIFAVVLAMLISCGKPKETEEMKPKWFFTKKLPYNKMWPDDIYWLPKVLAKKLLKAQFTFGKNDIVIKHKINIVDKL